MEGKTPSGRPRGRRPSSQRRAVEPLQGPSGPCFPPDKPEQKSFFVVTLSLRREDQWLHNNSVYGFAACSSFHTCGMRPQCQVLGAPCPSVYVTSPGWGTLFLSRC